MGTVPREQLVALLTPVAAAAGLDLEDVVLRSAGRRTLVQVSVDRDGGINLDDVAQVSRGISEALDATDVLGSDPYTLEVGSPGVDRPLTLPRHWRRAVGRLVSVTPKSGVPFVGRLVGLEPSLASFDTDSGSRTIKIEDVAEAVVEIEFNTPTASDD